MSVANGFKMTDLGVIPEDWDIEPLGALIGSLDAGVSVRSAADSTASYGHDVMVLKTSCISRGRFKPAEAKPVISADLSRVKTPARGGSMLISRMNTPDLVGEVGYVPQDWPNLYLPDRLWITCSAVGRKTDMRWLTALLAHGPAGRSLRDAATGTSGSMKNIGKAALRAVLIPSPTPTEQSAIAEALSDIDEAIATQEAVIAKKRALKIATMQALLSGTRRLPKFCDPARLDQFKHTEIGVIPDDWEVARLGDLLSRKPSYGINAPAVPFDDRLPRYLRITDIAEDGRFRKSSAVSVKHSSSEQYYLDPGDLVFARTGASTGKSYRYREADGRLVYAGFLIRVSPKSVLLDSNYLAAQVRTRNFEKYVAEVSQRSGQPGINGKQLADFQLPVPPTIDEQSAIADTLLNMDEDVEANETRLAKLRHVKVGMMQQLLTGKIRLV